MDALPGFILSIRFLKRRRSMKGLLIKILSMAVLAVVVAAPA